MAVVIGHDCIHANVSHLPRGQSAGYTTGTPDIKWTPADWAAHPKGVRICQDAGSDHTADVLDVERGAATNADAGRWAPAAIAAFGAGSRPGQRRPAVYTSASNVTPLVNALIADGVKAGIGLWVADWNLSDPQATADVENAAGPFPIVGVQFHSGQFYDTNIFSAGWLAAVSVNQAASHAHLTVAGDTLGGLAAMRGMDIWPWLDLQRKLSDPNAEHLVRHAAAEPGSTWRSVRP